MFNFTISATIQHHDDTHERQHQQHAKGQRCFEEEGKRSYAQCRNHATQLLHYVASYYCGGGLSPIQIVT